MVHGVAWGQTQPKLLSTQNLQGEDIYSVLSENLLLMGLYPSVEAQA